MTTKNLPQIAIFITLLASVGLIIYEAIIHVTIDVFFIGLVTLILGKYLQQSGFSQGSDSSATTVDNVAKGVVIGLNGGPAAQLVATQANTAALVSQSISKDTKDNTNAVHQNTIATDNNTGHSIGSI